MGVAVETQPKTRAEEQQKNAPSREEQLVVFNLGDEQFGIDIARVQEIIRWQRVTKVPNAPSFVEGVINLRGRVIPVIDLRHRLAMKAKVQGSDTRIVVVEMQGQIVGMIVDGVSEVLHIQNTMIEPPSPVITSSGATHLRGIARLEDRLIALLDFEQMLVIE